MGTQVNIYNAAVRAGSAAAEKIQILGTIEKLEAERRALWATRKDLRQSAARAGAGLIHASPQPPRR